MTNSRSAAARSAAASRRHANNRRAMALRLAEVLDGFPETTSATVAALPAEGRRMVEQLSGEARPASDDTWLVVVEILQGWEARKAEATLRVIDDEAFVPVAVRP